MAQNVRNGYWAATSIIHYDTERSHGQMPAPVTWFPPGYPIVIGLITQGPLEQTARIISSICFAGTVVLLAWALMLVEVAPVVRWLATLLLLANAVTLRFASNVMTEPMFSLVSTGAVVSLLWAARQRQHRRIAMGVAIGYSLAGLAYWVRYAGVFLILAFLCYSFLRLLNWRDRVSRIYAAAAIIPAGLAAVLMVRNQILVGTWRGGNESVRSHSVTSVLLDYLHSQIHLATGMHRFTFGFWEALLLAGVLVIGVLLFATRRAEVVKPDPQADSSLLLVLLSILFYTAGLFYVALRTVVASETRMFVPILPFYLLLFAMVGNRLAHASLVGPYKPWVAAGLLIFLAGYAGMNLRDFGQPPPEGRNEVLAAEYSMPDKEGQPLRAWVDAHIARGDVILAADGQATGYLLGRPTISLVTPEYTQVRWECNEIKKQMERFHACCVILYKPSPETTEDALLSDSRFVAQAATHTPPCGFTIAAENASIRVLKFTPNGN